MTEAPLTPRQRTIFGLLEGGLTAPEISRKLDITPSAVYGHIRAIRAAGVQIPGETVAASKAPAPRRVATMPEILGEAIAEAEAEAQAAEAEVTALKERLAAAESASDEAKTRVARHQRALAAYNDN